MTLRRFLLLGVLAAGCDPYIVNESRSGGVIAETCAGGTLGPTHKHLCPGEWKTARAPRSPDLARWRPPGQPLRLRVGKHSGSYSVETDGLLVCKFTTPAESKKAVSVPPETACLMEDRVLRVAHGWFREGGGMIAPTHVVVDLVLFDAEGLVRVYGELRNDR